VNYIKKICFFAADKKTNMETLKSTKIKAPLNNSKERQSYSVEEVFDRIDNKFIDFYGEYGRQIVNARRTEWNQDDEANFKML